MPLGEGDVGMETFLRTLDDLGYTGPLTIEREIPQEPEPAEGRDRPRPSLAGRLENEDRLSHRDCGTAARGCENRGTAVPGCATPLYMHPDASRQARSV